MTQTDSRAGAWHRCGRLLVGAVGIAILAGCGTPPEKPPPAPLDVATIRVEARDVPVSALYVAQTQSSQAVNIQARVSGFLDRRVYTEGAFVKKGQVLFRMDQKPFQAQVDGAAAALQRRRTRCRRRTWTTRKASTNRRRRRSRSPRRSSNRPSSTCPTP